MNEESTNVLKLKHGVAAKPRRSPFESPTDDDLVRYVLEELRPYDLSAIKYRLMRCPADRRRLSKVIDQLLAQAARTSTIEGEPGNPTASADFIGSFNTFASSGDYSPFVATETPDAEEGEELLNSVEPTTDEEELDTIIPGDVFPLSRMPYDEYHWASHLTVLGVNRSRVIGRATNLLASAELNLEEARFRVMPDGSFSFVVAASGARERVVGINKWFSTNGRSFFNQEPGVCRARLSRTWVAVFEGLFPDRPGITDAAAEIIKKWRSVSVSQFETCASISLLNGVASEDQSFQFGSVPVYHLQMVVCSPLRQIHLQMMRELKDWFTRPKSDFEPALRWACASFGKTDLAETFLVQPGSSAERSDWRCASLSSDPTLCLND